MPEQYPGAPQLLQGANSHLIQPLREPQGRIPQKPAPKAFLRLLTPSSAALCRSPSWEHRKDALRVDAAAIQIELIALGG